MYAHQILVFTKKAILIVNFNQIANVLGEKQTISDFKSNMNLLCGGKFLRRALVDFEDPYKKSPMDF